MTGVPSKTNIPVLTEVIALSTTPLNPASAPPPIRNRHTIETQSAANIREEDWDRWEQKIRERVLRDILERVNFVLEHRIKDSVAEVLQASVENMAKDIKNSLHQTLAEIVSRATTQEIARLKKTKNK